MKFISSLYPFGILKLVKMPPQTAKSLMKEFRASFSMYFKTFCFLFLFYAHTFEDLKKKKLLLFELEDFLIGV